MFQNELSAREKKDRLERDFNIPMTETFESEVDEMCNRSQGVAEEAMQKGIEKGRQEGIQKGIEQGRQEGMQKGMAHGIEQGIQQGRTHALAELVNDRSTHHRKSCREGRHVRGRVQKCDEEHKHTEQRMIA